MTLCSIRAKDSGLIEMVSRDEQAPCMTSRSSWSLGGLAIWAWLVPFMLLMRPYGGLVQDARIYVGRGVADLDPGGVGRDMMFAHDEQSRFSIMRAVVRSLLAALTPGEVSMLLALAGILLWLVAAAALARSLARGRAAWAAVVCVLVLPAQYGAFGVFSYAEAIATPRIFAEAAILGGLAALVSGHRLRGLMLLGAAMGFHPLMALPGLGLAALLLVRDDRRWLIPLGVVCAAILAAAALRLPLFDRLLVPVDTAWLGILRQRGEYLFPSRWPAAALSTCAYQLAAVAVAGSFSPPRVGALLWGTAGMAAFGALASLLFGDIVPSVLITQMQLWRWLWLLAVVGNASMALAAIDLWRRGSTAHVTLSLLALTFLLSAAPSLSMILAAVTVAWHVADLRGALPILSSRSVAVAVAVAAAIIDLSRDGAALSLLVQSAETQGGYINWPQISSVGLQTVPLVVAAVASALLSWRVAPLSARFGTAAALAAASVGGVLLWDGRTTERLSIEHRDGAAELRTLIGDTPGEILWIDERSEAWFFAARPAFFNAVQGAPILFSRELAIEWADRAANLLRLNLVRPEDVAPWADLPHSGDELVVLPTAVRAFCADPSRPAAIVAPGRQLAAAPPGWTVNLWRPAAPIRRLSTDDAGLHWRTIGAFTVIRCPASEVQHSAPRA